MSDKIFDFNGYNVRFENMLFLKLFLDKNFRNTVMPMLDVRYFNPPVGEYPYDLIFKYFQKFYLDGCVEITPVQVINAIKTNEKYIEPEDISRVKATFNNIGKLYAKSDMGFINSVDSDYLINITEKYIQEIAIELALIDSVDIIDNKPNEKLSIRGLLDDALSVGLKRDIGLDYNNTVRDRFEFYQKSEDKIPFLLDSLNKVTYKGFTRKTLSCFMAGTGIGKTLIMTSLVTDYIKQGYNVVYVTLEISEERIALRNDANLMNIPIGDFGRYENGNPVVSVDDLVEKFETIKNDEKLGRLIIKEYPTGSVTTLQIKTLLKELKLKEEFKADVIFIDYINLINSARMTGKDSNSYTMVKKVAEELRGIAVEEDVVMITATQTNRDGISGDEVALDKVSESAGLPHTTDFFCGIFQTEQQREQGIFILKVLKNRFSGYVNYKVAMGVNYNFMRFFQLDDSASEDAIDRDVDNSDASSSVFSTNKKKRRRSR